MGTDKEAGAEEFGQRLRARREALGLSRRDVVDASGLSYPYVSQLESGYRVPSHRSVARLATALDLEPSELSAVLPYPEVVAGQAPSRPAGAWKANPTYQGVTPSARQRSSARQVAAQVAELVSALPRDQRLEVLTRVQRQVLDRMVTEEVDALR